MFADSHTYSQIDTNRSRYTVYIRYIYYTVKRLQSVICVRHNKGDSIAVTDGIFHWVPVGCIWRPHTHTHKHTFIHIHMHNCALLMSVSENKADKNACHNPAFKKECEIVLHAIVQSCSVPDPSTQRTQLGYCTRKKKTTQRHTHTYT